MYISWLILRTTSHFIIVSVSSSGSSSCNSIALLMRPAAHARKLRRELEALEKQLKSPRPNKTPFAERRCEPCDMDFRTDHEFADHLRSTSIHRYDCLRCRLHITDPKVLSKHADESLSHYVCRKCKTDFSTMEVWRNHSVHQHNMCRFCLDYFESPQALLQVRLCISLPPRPIVSAPARDASPSDAWFLAAYRSGLRAEENEVPRLPYIVWHLPRTDSPSRDLRLPLGG